MARKVIRQSDIDREILAREAEELAGDFRKFVETIPNLFLVGRNGMHRYNNQDHSMLTAMMAVDNIVEGRTDKSNLWDVNLEMVYHEEKKK